MSKAAFSFPGESKPDLKGQVPENWLCVDCGVNTAPHLSTRAELEAAFAAGVESITNEIDDTSEVYTVRARVWADAGMTEFGGCLCVGCLEKRLGRKLRPKDFVRDNGFNQPHIPGTPRLLKRRGIR